MAENTEEKEEKKSLNFIEEIIEKDLSEGKNHGRVQTRFPPEPNGYLHIGHAKAIALDFGMAQKYGGVCNLRMDDTNPQKEDTEYVEAIKRDIEWLGFKWGKVLYASDYFQQLWDLAVVLIKQGKAYVDEQTSEQIAQQKGTPTQAGTESPYRNRPVEESLRLFNEMNSGKMEPGKMVLRAKIDMANSNMHFRDPIMYRVLNMPHWRTGNKWNAYPMYDYTHGQCDYWEGVTHSLCTLEFVPHRPLYDLFVDWAKEAVGDLPLDDNRPRQTEFNKLNLTHILLSKRNLLILVKEGVVNGWDDPRMPTISGFRRRGYSPESIINFIDKIGYTKFDALNQMSLFESAVRDDLNKRSLRVSAVLDPIKLIITNFPEGEVQNLTAQNNPENIEDGTHTVEFTRELWIEREDFMEDAPKKFLRLGPGKEVRLKHSFIIKCPEEGCVLERDADGNPTVIQAEYDPISLSGMEGADRKIKGKTIHWVSCNHCFKAEVRNYDRLWLVENPRDEVAAYSKEHGKDRIDIEDMKPFLNPKSLEKKTAYVELFAKDLKPFSYVQFQRTGYYNVDPDSTADNLVFNRTVGLKDSWTKPAAK